MVQLEVSLKIEDDTQFEGLSHGINSSQNKLRKEKKRKKRINKKKN